MKNVGVTFQCLINYMSSEQLQETNKEIPKDNLDAVEELHDQALPIMQKISDINQSSAAKM